MNICILDFQLIFIEKSIKKPSIKVIIITVEGFYLKNNITK